MVVYWLLVEPLALAVTLLFVVWLTVPVIVPVPGAARPLPLCELDPLYVKV